MITIFIVLGLAFLIGGVGAIVDGWPYLMIERGFTQVIIGTVGATGGVILLALSRVLAELRRVRTALSAMTLLSAAALPGEAEPRGRREERPVPAMEPTPVDVDRTAMLGPAVAGAGLAAAGGTFAAALAHDAAARESKAEPANETPPPLPSMVPPRLPAMREPDEDRPEPDTADLFDDAPAVPAAADEAADAVSERHEADEPPQGAAEPEDEAEDELPLAAQTSFGEADPKEEPEDASEAVPGDKPDLPVEPEATPDLPQDTPQPAEPAPSMWWPRIDTPRAPAEPERAATDFDDLASLRDHLTRGPQAPGGSGEGENESEEKTPDSDITAAESWMEPAFGRREPTFAEPAAEEPDSPADEEPAEQPAVADDEASAEQPDAGPREEPTAPEEEPASDADAPTPGETPRPAASDEGVVGAYQVGDTHFTMFADGSIRARTPEGEYSFASMEELKAYLASEKSRLGV